MKPLTIIRHCGRLLVGAATAGVILLVLSIGWLIIKKYIEVVIIGLSASVVLAVLCVIGWIAVDRIEERKKEIVK